jgi:hypothetical protein
LSELFSHSPIERVIDGVSDYVIGRVMDWMIGCVIERLGE